MISVGEYNEFRVPPVGRLGDAVLLTDAEDADKWRGGFLLPRIVFDY